MKSSFGKGLLKFSPALLAISIGSVILAGCDGDDDNDSPVIQTGQLIDAAVEGISFQTATQSGKTNEDGEFPYIEGEQVTFSIGGIEFGPVTATGVVTPLDLASSEDPNDSGVLNIARLLQSLDVDNDPSNGIKLPADLDALGDEPFDSWSAADFDTAIKNRIPSLELVSSGEAARHFHQSLRKLNEQPSLSLIGRFNEGQQLDKSMAEIVAFHKNSNSILVINASIQTVDILNAADLTSDTLSAPQSSSNLNRRSQLNVATDVTSDSFTPGGVNSVAVHENLMAIAVQSDNKQSDGVIAFYTLNDQGEATFLKKVTAGALPDNVQFSPDGNWAVSANEGEPSADYTNDPEGSVTVIAITDGTPADSATQVSFVDFNEGGSRASDLPNNVRISHPGASVAQDLEPEYVAFSGDSSKAYVSMQENNAIAVVDLTQGSIERIFGLGYKDHSAAGNGLDASNKDDGINIRTWDNLRGLYMPDSIAGFSKDGVNYVVTANEGDSREYIYNADQATCESAGHDFDEDDGCFSWVDEKRAGKLNLDSEVFTDASVQDNENLGRLKVMTTEGKSDDVYQTLYSFGTRSFSIFNADSGERVFDSGDDFERITAKILGQNGFNSTDDENDFDDRSDDKGPEPEALALGTIDGKDYAFIGLERTGGIMMYDITNPQSPKFVQYTINRDFSVNVEEELNKAGDLAPEGMKFVATADSPTGKALLIVGNEVSGTTTVYEVATLEDES